MSSLLSELVIRKVKEEDLPALEWDGEFKHFRRLYAEAYRRSLLGEAVLWLAEFPGKGVIGQLFVHLRSERPELADGKSRGYVYGFRVRPAYRDKGVGTRLLITAEEDLLKRGYRYTVLNVGQDNPDARRLYERNGYRVIGNDPGNWYFIDDRGVRRDVHEPAWRMQKLLDHKGDG